MPCLRQSSIRPSPRILGSNPGRSCLICDGQSNTDVCFSPSLSFPHCQYHSTNAPHAYLFTCFCYQKDEREKPGNLETNKCCFEKLGSVGRRVQPYFSSGSRITPSFPSLFFVTDHQSEENGVTLV